MRHWRNHPIVQRLPRFLTAGVGTALFSFGLYMGLIHWLGMAVVTASLMRGVCMIPVTFMVGRHFTWRDKRSLNSVWWQLAIHVISRPASFGVHQLIMLGCLGFHIHYALAYWISVSLTGVFNLYWGEKCTFHPRWAKRRTAPLQAAPQPSPV